jgi:hypothetical protein
VSGIESLPWPALSVATGGWTLFALAGWFVLTGRLVPGRFHREVVHDRNEWRAESRIKDAQIAEKDTQLRHMAEVGKTSEAVLLKLRQMADQEAT